MAVIFDGCVMMFCFEQMNCILVPAGIGTNRYTIPKTNSSPLKMDGWNTIYLPFGASKGLFSGAVGFREGKTWWDFFGVSFGEILKAKRWTKTSG